MYATRVFAGYIILVLIGARVKLLYVDIEKALFCEGKPEEFHVKIAQTPKEVKGLLEVGFEYVCEKDGLLFFRKRK